MLNVDADLVAMFATQNAAAADHSAGLLGQLVRVLERLPPGPTC